jgi:hypothetical protein
MSKWGRECVSVELLVRRTCVIPVGVRYRALRQPSCFSFWVSWGGRGASGGCLKHTELFKPPQKVRPPHYVLHVLPTQAQACVGGSAGWLVKKTPSMREAHSLNQAPPRSKGLHEPAGKDGCGDDEVAEEGIHYKCSRLASEGQSRYW